MRSVRSIQIALVVIVAVVAVSLPYLSTPFWLTVAVDMCAFAIVGISYNLLLGRIGLISFGHALFFGASGYGVAILTTKSGLPLVVAIVLALVLSTVLAALVAVFAAKARGIYFGMLTLAVAEVGYTIAEQDVGHLTGGDNGMSVAAIPELLNVNLRQDVLYWVALAVVVAVLLFVMVLNRSSAGRLWVAIRENERRAEALGVDVGRQRLIAFTLAGALAGVAGVLHALTIQTITPADTAIAITVQALLITIIGGTGSFWGPVVGAVFVRALPPLLDQLASTSSVQTLPTELQRAVTSQFMWLGLIYIAIVLWLPGGVASAFNRLLARLVGERRDGPRDEIPTRGSAVTGEPPTATPAGSP